MWGTNSWDIWAQVYGCMNNRVLKDFIVSMGEYRGPEDFLERYGESTEFSLPVLPVDWVLIRDYAWTQLRGPVSVPIQGWKILISSTYADAHTILERSIPACIEFNAAIIFPSNREMLKLINSAVWRRELSCRFISVLADNRSFKSLLDRLTADLKSYKGPYILGSQRSRNANAIYYNYEPFKLYATTWNCDGKIAASLVNPEGNLEGYASKPWFSIPDWVASPEEIPPAAESLGLNGRYAVTSAIEHLATGGIYIGLDLESGRRVLIREARSLVIADNEGSLATTVLEREFRMLSKLETLNVAPKPLDLFWEWEHLFLVATLPTGKRLNEFPISPGKHSDEEEIITWETAVRALWCNLVRVVSVLHQNGIVVGHIEPRNILYDPTTFDVTILKLDSAVCEGGSRTRWLRNPRYTRDRGLLSQTSFADDYYGLAMTFLNLLSPLGNAWLSKSKSSWFLEPSLCQKIGLLDASTVAAEGMREAKAEPDLYVGVLNFINEKTPRINVYDSPFEELCEKILRSIIRRCSEELQKAAFSPDQFWPFPLSVKSGMLGCYLLLYQCGERVSSTIVSRLKTRYRGIEQGPPGLLNGLAGAAWCWLEMGDEEFAERFLVLAMRQEVLFNSPGIAEGVAGLGMSCLRIWNETRCDKFLRMAIRLAQWLISSRVDTRSGSYWPLQDGSVPIGYGYGATGIGLFFLYLYVATGNAKYMTFGESAINFDLSQVISPSASLSFFPERVSVVSPQHRGLLYGNGGVANVLMQFAKFGPEDKWSERLRPIINGLCSPFGESPGLLRGLSGQGNCLIDYACFSKQTRWFHIAQEIAAGVLRYRTGESLGEATFLDDNGQENLSIESGAAGIGLFLGRLTHHERANLFDLSGTLDSSKGKDDRDRN